MKKLVQEYHGKSIEDWGSEVSPDFKSLARKFKNALKREFPDFTVENYNTGHYYISGFLQKDNNHIYFSWSVPRYQSPINMISSNYMEGILYRDAASSHDYTGGANRYSSVKCFGEDVRDFYESFYGCETEKEEDREDR